MKCALRRFCPSVIGSVFQFLAQIEAFRCWCREPRCLQEPLHTGALIPRTFKALRFVSKSLYVTVVSMRGLYFAGTPRTRLPNEQPAPFLRSCACALPSHEHIFLHLSFSYNNGNILIQPSAFLHGRNTGIQF